MPYLQNRTKMVNTRRTYSMENQGDILVRTLTANDRLRRPLLMHVDPAVEMHQPASPVIIDCCPFQLALYGRDSDIENVPCDIAVARSFHPLTGISFHHVWR